MKDKQGITRGKCIVVDCECTEYVKSQDSGGVRCDYCDHVPVKHVKMIKLGACTNCKECPSYESEDSGSYSDCAYCDCPAQFHKDADKLFPKQPSQPASAEVQSVSSLQAMVSVGGTTQLAISQVQAALKCKLPGCDKPCHVESNGRAHDFCSKAHAITYTKQQQRQQWQILQQPLPSMLPSTGSSMPDASVKPTQAPPSFEKVCTKCGKKPANPRRGWCQDCYIQSKQT